MGSATKRIQYRYDARGNRQSMIDPDGGRFTYSYDARNRIQSLQNPQGERTTYSYDVRNRRTVMELANGTRTSYVYDAVSNLRRLSNLKSDGSVISDLQYSYDKTGNRTSVVEGDGRRVTWSYDAASQLICEHRPAESWNDLSLDDWDTLSPEGWGALSVDSSLRTTYAYDPAGNRTLKNEGGARTTYSYDAANQLKWSQDASGRTTYTFDADGNQERVLSPDGSRTTTTWDYENRATSIRLPSGIRNTMSYEPGGLRVKLEESTGTKKFVWDDQNYLAETDGSNDTQVVYTNEPRYYGNLVSQRRASTTSWYHFDALGSTRQLTDATQAITDQRLYDAWGTVIGSSGSTLFPFRYVGIVGYYTDIDHDTIYVRARFYRPTMGRWESADSILTILYSLYVYAKSQPIGLVDTNGRQPSRQRVPPPAIGITKKQCDQWLNNLFKGPLVKPHLDAVKNCKAFKFVVPTECKECNPDVPPGEDRLGGGWLPDKNELLVCYDHQRWTEDKGELKFALMLVHELMHGIDACGGIVAKGDASCEQTICSESRAITCSGQCYYLMPPEKVTFCHMIDVTRSAKTNRRCAMLDSKDLSDMVAAEFKKPECRCDRPCRGPEAFPGLPDWLKKKSVE